VVYIYIMGEKNSTAALGDVDRDGLPDLAGKLRMMYNVSPLSMMTMKWWYKKYVVLKGRRLEIFRNARESEPDFVYDISNCKVEDPKSSHLNTVVLEFGISSNDVTWLTFRAKDAGQRHMWVNALRHAVQEKILAITDSEDIDLSITSTKKNEESTKVEDGEEEEEDKKENNNKIIHFRIRSHSSYDIVETDHLKDVIQSKIDLVASNLNIRSSRARLFLVETRWNVAKFQETWKNSKVEFLKMMKLEEEETSSLIEKENNDKNDDDDTKSNNEIECPVCYEDFKEKDMIHPEHCSSLHIACRDCWQRHIENEIKSEGNCVVKCIHQKCFEPLTDKFIKEFGGSDVFGTYLSTTKASYVNRNENVIWCPNPKSCGRAVIYREGVSCDIRCKCGYEFCFKCRALPHGTATCSHAKQWREMEKTIVAASKESGDSKMTISDMTYLLENVKPCPRCKNTIERNHGCDQMTCRLGAGGCGHQFCWICLQPTKNHDQNVCAPHKGDERIKKILGMFELEVGALVVLSFSLSFSISHTHIYIYTGKQLEKFGVSKITKRFEAYFLRVLDRRKALEFAKQSSKNILRSSSHHELTDEDKRISTLLCDALSLVMQAHHHLSWTYVQSFFLKSEVDLFSDVLHSVRVILEEHTERLHDMVESWKELYVRGLNSKGRQSSVLKNYISRMLAQSNRVNEALVRLRRTMEWLKVEKSFKSLNEDEEEKEEDKKTKEEETTDEKVETTDDEKVETNDDEKVEMMQDKKDEDDEDDENTTPLPDGWRRVVDWSSGRAYYFNNQTRRSQWEKPWTAMMSRDDFSSVQMKLMNDPTPWQCTRCTFINQPGGVMCSMCHNMRALKRPKKKSSGEKEDEKWECAQCTFMNDSNLIQCAICFGMEKREKKKEEKEEEEEEKEKEEDEKAEKEEEKVGDLETKSSSSEDPWICMLCETENEHNVRRCVVCDTPSARRSGVIPAHVRKLLKTPEKRRKSGESLNKKKQQQPDPVLFKMKSLESE